MMKKTVTLLLVCLSFVLHAQERRFWKEIQAFKAHDSVKAPPRNAIVFVGSSSFKLWKDVANAFPDHVIINRGFGGSSLPHVIDYAYDIIIPYKPKQVVVYCGENDFTNDTVTSEIVTKRFITLFELLRKEIPKAEIIFVSMKPSPSRRHLWEKMEVSNKAIRDYLATKKRARFIDIWDAMLDKAGEPRRELFLKDMLHMNADGYAIWQKALEPYLK